LRRRSTSSTVLLLLVVFLISYLAFTCAPYNHDQLLKVPQLHVEKAFVFASFLFNQRENAASTLLNQTTRMTVFELIKDNPGLHFRAISQCLNMPFGVLQYHLGLLIDHGLISVYGDRRYKRFFESKKFTEAEMKTISTLRHKTSGKILVALFEKPQTTHKELSVKLGVSSQALSWHMSRLEKMGFIRKNVDGLKATYSLDERTRGSVSHFAALV